MIISVFLLSLSRYFTKTTTYIYIYVYIDPTSSSACKQRQRMVMVLLYCVWEIEIRKDCFRKQCCVVSANDSNCTAADKRALHSCTLTQNYFLQCSFFKQTTLPERKMKGLYGNCAINKCKILNISKYDSALFLKVIKDHTSTEGEIFNKTGDAFPCASIAVILTNAADETTGACNHTVLALLLEVNNSSPNVLSDYYSQSIPLA